MMYPRLRLARNLLSVDGVIFISIDDNEVKNLRFICDEIFGEYNFVAQIVVEGTPKNDPYIVSTAHEYCLVYCKNFELLKNRNYGLSNPVYSKINAIFDNYKNDFKTVEEKLKEFYIENNLNKDNISNYKYADSKGVFRIGPIDDPQSGGPKDNRINPNTGNNCSVPSQGWRCTLDTWNKWIKDDLILFPENDEKLPSKKTYIQNDRLDVMKAYFKIQTRKDTNSLKKLFNLEFTPFPNPKPKELIKNFIKNTNDKNMVVLDFFSGSGTTSESIIDLNNEDNGKRKFILVQIPETISLENATSNKTKKIIQTAINFLERENKSLNICEIGKERIRRAGEKIKSESGNESLDIGFKVFKLDSSNLKEWDPDYNNLEQTLIDSTDNLVPGRSELDSVYEIMLKYGLDLTLAITEYEIGNNKVYSIGYGSLLICLDDNITKEIAIPLVEKIKELSPETIRVVFKDNGFKCDSDKTNIKETLKINNVDEFVTV